MRYLTYSTRQVFLPRLSTGQTAIGSVSEYTDRSLAAINHHLNRFVLWLHHTNQAGMEAEILRQFGLLQCIGHVNGTHIILSQAPSQSKRSSNSYHSYKKKYGSNVMAVINNNKRFTFIHWGYLAAASNMHVQKASRLHSNPEEYFSEG